MQALLMISRAIDGLTALIGKLAMWAIFASTVISAGNALMRYALGIGSNALLEIQWYLFAAVFMMGAGYAFMRNVHVRIDFLSNRFSPRTRNWVDVVGIVIVLFPMCLMISWYAWPLMVNAYVGQETSFNPGGLLRWPLYALLPAGFGLLGLQGVSELIKRLHFLFGDGPDVLMHDHHHEEAFE